MRAVDYPQRATLVFQSTPDREAGRCLILTERSGNVVVSIHARP